MPVIVLNIVYLIFKGVEAYDAVGNFTYKSDFSAANAYLYGNANKNAGTNNNNAGSNAVRQVTLANGRGTRQYSYDLNGNLTGDGTRSYVYNV